MPNFTYTGLYEIVRSTHPANGSERYYVRFLTSGMLTFDMDANVDAFLVGGGSSGSRAWGDAGGAGGGGGYTANYYNVAVGSGVSYSVVIGSGGVASGDYPGGGGTSQFGGLAIAGAYGSNGGSGGGGAGDYNDNSPIAYGGNGGSDGSDGATHNPSGWAGSGQHTTTRPFAGTMAPFNNMLFAGGGGGGGYCGSARDAAWGGSGGAGGGGYAGYYSPAWPVGSGPDNISYPENGDPNTGGGGGGSWGGMNYVVSASGGSGIVILRVGDWSA